MLNRRSKKNVIVKVLASLIIIFFAVNSIDAQKDFKQTGEASFYSDKFEGRYTASGEKYSGKELTAAHLTLPFNTMVKVVNLANSNTVVVRINDRGPFLRGRIIDLSKAAAKELDILDEGTAKVRIEVVGEEKSAQSELKPAQNVKPPSNEQNDNKPKSKAVDSDKQENNNAPDENYKPVEIKEFYNVTSTTINAKGYAIQIASYKESANLLRTSEEISKKVQEKVIVQVVNINNEKIYRVLIGPLSSREKAEQLKSAISDFYPQSYVVDLSAL